MVNETIAKIHVNYELALLQWKMLPYPTRVDDLDDELVAYFVAVGGDRLRAWVALAHTMNTDVAGVRKVEGEY